MTLSPPPLILASRSPFRAKLLRQLGVAFTTDSADLDEAVRKGETPETYVRRIARDKALAVAARHPNHVVLAADTPVAVGRRILQTPETAEEAAAMLRLQSNRRVRIATAVACVDAQGKLREGLARNWIKVKPLGEADIKAYLAAGCWRGCAGGVRIEDMEPWVLQLQGTLSGIIGLPLAETARLLQASGITPQPFGPRVE